MKVSPPLSAGLLVISLVLLVTGCAAPVTEQERAGFISDYSKLSKASSKAYLYTNPNVARYHSFIVERPVIMFEPATSGENSFSESDLEDIQDYFQQALIEAVSKDDKFKVVEEPGPGVARIRVALTNVDATVGVLNVSMATKITGAGLGGAAMEGEILCTETEEQLGASIQWGSGSRVLRAGLTKMGDAKIQINAWAKTLRERLDEVAEG